MAKAKKPFPGLPDPDRKIMDALTKKVKSITVGKKTRIDVSLKRAIRQSGRTYYDLGRAAGVAPSVILRFMSDDPQARGGDMRLSTAAKLAAELGLELTFTG